MKADCGCSLPLVPRVKSHPPFCVMATTVDNGIGVMTRVVFPDCRGRGGECVALACKDRTPFVRPIDRRSMHAIWYRLGFATVSNNEWGFYHEGHKEHKGGFAAKNNASGFRRTTGHLEIGFTTYPVVHGRSPSANVTYPRNEGTMHLRTWGAGDHPLPAGGIVMHFPGNPDRSHYPGLRPKGWSGSCPHAWSDKGPCPRG